MVGMVVFKYTVVLYKSSIVSYTIQWSLTTMPGGPAPALGSFLALVQLSKWAATWALSSPRSLRAGMRLGL